MLMTDYKAVLTKNGCVFLKGRFRLFNTALLIFVCLNFTTFNAIAADVDLITWNLTTTGVDGGMIGTTRTYNPQESPLPSPFTSAVMTNVGGSASTIATDNNAFILRPISASQYHEMRFALNSSVEFSGVKFHHKHNHIGTFNYDVQLQFSSDNGANWENIGSAINMSLGNHDTTNTIAFARTLNAGSYLFRWHLVGTVDFGTAPNIHYFALSSAALFKSTSSPISASIDSTLWSLLAFLSLALLIGWRLRY